MYIYSSRLEMPNNSYANTSFLPEKSVCWKQQIQCGYRHYKTDQLFGIKPQ